MIAGKRKPAGIDAEVYHGFRLLDCQQQTPHMGRFGAHEIQDAAYAALLADCRHSVEF